MTDTNTKQRNGYYWIQASNGQRWEIARVDHGEVRTMFGERWPESETYAYGDEIVRADVPKGTTSTDMAMIGRRDVPVNPPTVRQAARASIPLEGPDAQALESALQQVERELAQARERIAALEALDVRTQAALQDLRRQRDAALASVRELEAAIDEGPDGPRKRMQALAEHDRIAAAQPKEKDE